MCVCQCVCVRPRCAGGHAACRGRYFTESRWRFIGLAYVGGDQLAVGTTLNTMAGRGRYMGCEGSYGESLLDIRMLFAVTDASRRFTWTLPMPRQGGDDLT